MKNIKVLLILSFAACCLTSCGVSDIPSPEIPRNIAQTAITTNSDVIITSKNETTVATTTSKKSISKKSKTDAVVVKTEEKTTTVSVTEPKVSQMITTKANVITKKRKNTTTYKKPQEKIINIKDDISDIHIPIPKNPEKLSTEQENLIKNDWFLGFNDNPRYSEYDASHVNINNYYGTYNDFVAIKISDPFTAYTCALWDDIVAGITIKYTDGNSIILWKDGEFFRLEIL